MPFKSAQGAACLQLPERLFHSFAPLNEKDFMPFSVNMEERVHLSF